jgi:hypothetical protein
MMERRARRWEVILMDSPTKRLSRLHDSEVGAIGEGLNLAAAHGGLCRAWEASGNWLVKLKSYRRTAGLTREYGFRTAKETNSL